jgi:hypothetical protein
MSLALGLVLASSLNLAGSDMAKPPGKESVPSSMTMTVPGR